MMMMISNGMDQSGWRFIRHNLVIKVLRALGVGNAFHLEQRVVGREPPLLAHIRLPPYPNLVNETHEVNLLRSRPWKEKLVGNRHKTCDLRRSQLLEHQVTPR